MDDPIAVTCGPFALPRAKVATLKTLPTAAYAATELCPSLPWRDIFEALDAAGLVAFGAGGVDDTDRR